MGPMTRSGHRFFRFGLTFLLAPAIAGCGKTVPPPVDPPLARRSADEIIATAKLSPEVAPRVAFEIHRLDAYAACSAAQARFEGRARVRASSSASAGLLGGIVVGGLGLVGGVVTTVLAAGLEAPPVPSTPQPPDVDPPSVEGKTGVVVAGVVTGLAVVGAAVITVLLATGGSDDDKDEKHAPPSAPGPIGAAVGQVGGVLGQVGGALGPVGAGVSVQAGGVQVGAGASVEPVSTPTNLSARISAFQSECPDDPPESALQACTDKARILRLACSAGPVR